MSDEHERIDELLASYAVRGLDGEDAREAERLLSEHLPGCARCRETLAILQDVVGELGLAPAPVEPPELLLTRLRTEIREQPAVSRRPLAVWAAAAAAVAMLGLVTWNTVLNQRLGHVQSTQRKVTDAVTFMNQPGTGVVDLTDRTHAASRVLMGYRPQEARVFLLGTGVPEPAPGRVYRLWLGQDGQFTFYGEFLPDDGLVVLPLSFDATRYEEILITEEPASQDPSEPRGSHQWSARLALPAA
jgi:hypothetical protein